MYPTAGVRLVASREEMGGDLLARTAGWTRLRPGGDRKVLDLLGGFWRSRIVIVGVAAHLGTAQEFTSLRDLRWSSVTFKNTLPLLVASVMVVCMITPNDIADELGITAKALRTFLRDQSNGFARSPVQHWQRYEFSRPEADEIKRAHRAKRSPTPARLKGSPS